MSKNKTETTSVGVCVADDVLKYLGELELHYGCSRSFLINSIVREHAARGEHRRGSEMEVELVPPLAPVIQM